MAVVDLGSPHIEADIDGRVLRVVINRPEKRNAFAQDMYRAIKRAAIYADSAPEVAAVVLTGRGEWFGAGGDLSRREDVADLASEWDGTDHFPFRHIERCRKIWVASINGTCHAGGLGITLHCDVTVASDRAKFRVPELLRGLPDPYISERLIRAVGLQRARNLVFSAREIDALTAESWGLIGEVVEHDRLDARTDEIVDVVLRMGPTAKTVMKREMNRHLPIADPSAFMRIPSDEMSEGMRAFVEKRDPVWPERDIRA